MNRKQSIWTAVVLVVLLAGIYLYSHHTIRYNWYETYELESHEPYGTYVIGQLLKHYFPGKKFTVSQEPLDKALMKQKEHPPDHYVFIGKDLQLDEAETDSLLAFVASGHDAFISAGQFSTELLNHLLPDTGSACTDARYISPSFDSLPVFNFYSDTLYRKGGYSFHYAFHNHIYSYPWQSFDSALYCGEANRSLVLGFMADGYVNYAQIPFGKGFFYLHTVPLAFTNYSLTDSIHLEYASRVFSFLSSGTILWDEYSKLPGNLDFNSELNLSQSPLQYILAQRSLRWAWYAALGFLLAYLFFFIRRRHRIVPVTEPPSNTSLEFIRTVGQLYFQQQNHHALAMHKIRLLRAFLRAHYETDGGAGEDSLVQKISVKSQVPAADIKAMLAACSEAERNINLDSAGLLSLHQVIELFYTSCK